jgi:2-methylisocitrate lyase-like PEP mutase family enzyme
LHERPGCFLIPNPWDSGTYKLLTNLGFEALAMTSAGLAFSLGRPDLCRKLSLEEILKLRNRYNTLKDYDNKLHTLGY